MNEQRRSDLDASSRAFESISGTTLQKLIKGSLISCEGHIDDCNSIGFNLDVLGGIDYLSVNEHGIRGLAVRCQFGDAYNSFTIRYSRPSGNKTEHEKRLYQIDNGYIYPEFTIQCYFDSTKNNELLSMAIIRTDDLFYEIEHNDKVIEKESNNKFKVIHWNHIPKSKIKTWYRPIKTISI